VEHEKPPEAFVVGREDKLINEGINNVHVMYHQHHKHGAVHTPSGQWSAAAAMTFEGRVLTIL
jgi:hypothetical protein